MRWFCILFLAAAALPAVWGCGSGPSQAEMRALAMRRGPGDDDEEDDSGPTAAAVEPSPASASDQDTETDASPSELPASNAAAATSAAEPARATPGRTGPPGETAAPDHAPDANNSPPATPLTETERRQRSIDNMKAIAAALCEQVDQTGLLPPNAIYAQSKQPLLSWRVALLPQLGYQELHRRFKLDQPWDSPHNQKLLAEIPPVYQSPERFDSQTNYLVPVASGSAFQGSRGVARKHVEDGLANTALLLEVDDRLAVPWTQPLEYHLDLAAPARDLGALRGGEFFVAWGDGAVGQVSATISPANWKAMFTIDSGERFYAAQVSSKAVAAAQPDVVEPQEPLAADPQQPGAEDATGIGQEPVTASAAGFAAGKNNASTQPAGRTAAMGSSPTGSVRPGGSSPPQKAAVPTAEQQRLAMDTLRDLYRSEYEAARTAEDQRDLAKTVLDRSHSMPADSVGRFVALELSRKIASQAGDVDTALTAAEQAAESFDVDPLAIRAEALAATSRLPLEQDDNQTVLRLATELSEEALKQDKFALADRLAEAALAAARRLRDPLRVAEAMAVKRKIDSAEVIYDRVLDAVELLDTTTGDPQSNLTVGSYYCFIKGRWDDGLPMLARGSNARLAQVAQVELASPQTGEEQVAMADRWWNLAESGGRFEAAMRRRAACWYALALPNLPAGIQRVKAEIRVQQADASEE